MTKNAGTYVITCTASGRAYVGSSVNLTRRRSGHFSQLRKGIHPIREMQEDFDRHGSKAFTFLIINDLLQEEQRLYDGLLAGSARIYNSVRPGSRVPKPSPFPPGYPRYYLHYIRLRVSQSRIYNIRSVVAIHNPEEFYKSNIPPRSRYYSTYKEAIKKLDDTNAQDLLRMKAPISVRTRAEQKQLTERRLRITKARARKKPEKPVTNPARKQPPKTTTPKATANVTPKDLLSFRASAKLVKLSEDGLRYYLGEHGEPKFPDPFTKLEDRPLYHRHAVLRWKKEYESATEKRGRPRKSTK